MSQTYDPLSRAERAGLNCGGCMRDMDTASTGWVNLRNTVFIWTTRIFCPVKT